ncbi:STAS domain-containing protein [Nonomuraea sp. NPDC059194]|uniref:STAS domain-containing protein n=1 Tax=Nonomuraea sp. NPDC059194 TaxID=3346764 RepID=UPI0036AC69AC
MDAAHGMGAPGPVVHGADALEVSPLSDRSGIRARGAISSVTRPCWEAALAELTRQHAEVSYLELADVGFVDVAGVTALAIMAMKLPGRRFVVEHPPPQLPRVLQMFWPGMREIVVVPR